MCGICGIVGESNENLIRRMTETMIHRGPDDEGFYLDENISLGVRRLAIIDLETGHQPIFNEDNSVCVILNGEIYNFQELRKDLEKRGHRFSTRTDTEVIVHSYEEFGEKCLDRFTGMFAFAIWDKRERKLFLARDRMGIKPLYFTQKNGKLIFASEIKAILCFPDIQKEVNVLGLDLYASFQYVPAPLTMFKGIEKLKPGHYLIWQDGKVSIQQYWNISFQKSGHISIEEAKEELLNRLKNAVELRLISDVPLGVLLSGGIDSSTITALMSFNNKEKVNTFTVRFKDGIKYDEGYFAKIVSDKFGTNHHEFILGSTDIGLLPRLIWYLDEPVADPASVPLYYICQIASKYVKVVLTGEGGDEVFGGYPRYLLHKLSQYSNKLSYPFIKIFTGAFRNLPFLSNRYQNLLTRLNVNIEDISLKNTEWIANFNEDEKKLLFRREFYSKRRNNMFCFLKNLTSGKVLNEWFDELILLDMRTWLVDDILMKTDKMSMANSIEARVPFLDHHLIDFITSIPVKIKLKNFTTKYILKKTMEEILPKDIIYRKKKPFNIPISDWFRNDLKGIAIDYILDKDSAINEYFSSSYIRELLGSHFTTKNDNAQKIWNILCFELWHKIFVENIRHDILCDDFKEKLNSARRREKVHLLIPWDYPPARGGIQTYMHNIYSRLDSGELMVLVDKINGAMDFDIFEKYQIKRFGTKWFSNYNRVRKSAFYLNGILYSIWLAYRKRIRFIHCGHILSGTIAVLVKKIFGIKFIVWTHALEIMDNKKKQLIKYVLNNADKIITNSDFTGNFIKKLCGANVDIVKIPPPIDINRFVPGLDSEKIKEKHNIKGKKVILTVCRLTNLQIYKGIDKVIEAISIIRKKIPDAVYVIVGSGELMKYYKCLAEKSGCSENIIFSGNISDEELPLYYNACDLFIMVSREERNPKGIFAEGFGIVFLEANACSKPVIGGRSGGIPDAVLDGETGLLVDPNNIDEIASAIIKLLTDEKLAKEMGMKGRERVLKEFTVDKAVQKLMRVIKEIST